MEEMWSAEKNQTEEGNRETYGAALSSKTGKEVSR